MGSGWAERAGLPPGFDAAAVAATLRPFAEAEPLPARAHHDEAWFRLDQAAVLRDAWRMVARGADAALPGAVHRVPWGEGGALLVRGPDLVLRAFRDVCPHRGAELVGRARTRRVVAPPPLPPGACLACPYHGYAFDHRGALTHAPGARGALARATLFPLQALEWGGFVLLREPPPAASPGLDTPDVRDGAAAFAAGAPPVLRALRLAQLVRGSRRRWVTRANWKLVVGNFQESHHFGTVHPGLEARTPWRRSTSFHDDPAWLGGTMELAAGDETVSLDGRRHGRPFLPGLPRDERQRVTDVLRFPGWMLSVQPDYLLSYAIEPLDARRTRVTAEIFFHAEARDEDGAVVAPDVFAFWRQVNAEDRAICESQQRGVASPAFARGHYAGSEDGVHAFERRVAERWLAWAGARD